MGLRFRKSIKLCKGVKLNLGSKSASISVGGKGFHQTFSTTGRTTSSVGIPGTGVSYQKSVNMKKGFLGLFGNNKDEKEKKTSSKISEAAPAVAPAPAVAAIDTNAEERVREYEDAINTLRTIHTESDKTVDWNNITDPGLKGIADRILKGDTDAYLEVIALREPFEDLVDYGSEFEIGTDDPSKLEIEFDIKAEETIPVKSLSLTSAGKLAEKEMTKTAYYELMQDYVCSVMLKIARDSFALLPVNEVTVHATDVILNPATGNDESVTLVSAVFDRASFEQINFERIDPSETVRSFRCNMDFKKTKGFSPVAPIGE